MSVPVGEREEGKFSLLIKAESLARYTIEITANEKVDECYNSWKNHASKGDSYKLLQRTDKYVKELRKEESK